jgi:hypothetical protein
VLRNPCTDSRITCWQRPVTYSHCSACDRAGRTPREGPAPGYVSDAACRALTHVLFATRLILLCFILLLDVLFPFVYWPISELCSDGTSPSSGVEFTLRFRMSGFRFMSGGIRRTDHATPFYPQKLALTSPTSNGLSVCIVRSRTKATELVGWTTVVTDDIRGFVKIIQEYSWTPVHVRSWRLSASTSHSIILGATALLWSQPHQ